MCEIVFLYAQFCCGVDGFLVAGVGGVAGVGCWDWLVYPQVRLVSPGNRLVYAPIRLVSLEIRRDSTQNRLVSSIPLSPSISRAH